MLTRKPLTDGSLTNMTMTLYVRKLLVSSGGWEFSTGTFQIRWLGKLPVYD